jgi:hypothetical protein
MAGHQLIEGYLAELGRKLPAGIVEELADGLIETWQHYLRAGMRPDDAANAAIVEFGTTQQVNDAFVVHARGRRTARLLLATGPLFGLCWGTTLITAHAWTWPIPVAGAVIFAVALIGVVVCLALAATTEHHYHRARLGNSGALGLVALDAAMLAAVLMIAPHLVWPMAIAIPASLARIGLTVQSLPIAKRIRGT